MGAKLQKRNSNSNMGLFRSRDKSNDRQSTASAARPLSEAPSAATATTASTQLSDPASSNSLQNSSNASTAPTSTSNLSSNPPSSNNLAVPQKVVNQPAGTVVTTTTTTTTSEPDLQLHNHVLTRFKQQLQYEQMARLVCKHKSTIHQQIHHQEPMSSSDQMPLRSKLLDRPRLTVLPHKALRCPDHHRYLNRRHLHQQNL